MFHGNIAIFPRCSVQLFIVKFSHKSPILNEKYHAKLQMKISSVYLLSIAKVFKSYDSATSNDDVNSARKFVYFSACLKSVCLNVLCKDLKGFTSYCQNWRFQRPFTVSKCFFLSWCSKYFILNNVVCEFRKVTLVGGYSNFFLIPSSEHGRSNICVT